MLCPADDSEHSHLPPTLRSSRRWRPPRSRASGRPSGRRSGSGRRLSWTASARSASRWEPRWRKGRFMCELLPCSYIHMVCGRVPLHTLQHSVHRPVALLSAGQAGGGCAACSRGGQAQGGGAREAGAGGGAAQVGTLGTIHASPHSFLNRAQRSAARSFQLFCGDSRTLRCAVAGRSSRRRSGASVRTSSAAWRRLDDARRRPRLLRQPQRPQPQRPQLQPQRPNRVSATAPSVPPSRLPGQLLLLGLARARTAR